MKPQERKQARNLRRQGKALKVIARELGVSSSSVYRWCLDIQLTPEQRAVLDQASPHALAAYNSQKRIAAQQQRQRDLEAGRQQFGVVDDRGLLFLGVALYMGEGDKGPYRVGMTNMDPNLHRLFLRWLVLLDAPLDRLRACLYLSPDFEAAPEIQWWCRELGLQPEHFGKVVRKVSPTRIRGTRRKNYHGVLSLRLGDVKLRTRIQGMITAACQ